jgi:predicted TIM-barrel fold metal-dependent hydrolase
VADQRDPLTLNPAHAKLRTGGDVITANGEPIPVVDAHHHVGAASEVNLSVDWMQEDIVARKAQMDRMGIDGCVVLPAPVSAGGFRNVDHSAMNNSIAAYSRLAGDFVEGIAATVNPVEVEPACREMKRAFTELGMAAVVFHHRFLGMQINDPRMNKLLEVADDHQRAVFIHIIADSGLEAPWRLFSLAKRFPGVRFLALDGFSNGQQSQMLSEWAPDFPNVWFDTGAMVSVAHGLESFLGACGPDRLVLGTDLYSGPPHFHQAFPVLELAALGLPKDDLEKICSRNIRALLRPGDRGD